MGSLHHLLERLAGWRLVSQAGLTLVQVDGQLIPVAAATARSGNTRQARSRQEQILRQMAD